MSSLSAIPIRIEQGAAPSATGTIGGGVTAILAEVATLLERLVAGGEPSAIDLRSLPMSPGDRERLIEALGPGEMTITLRDDGESAMRETAAHGVWWTEYRDRNGEVTAEFIEIARVPAIVTASETDMRRGAARLRAVIAAHPKSED